LRSSRTNPDGGRPADAEAERESPPLEAGELQPDGPPAAARARARSATRDPNRFASFTSWPSACRGAVVVTVNVVTKIGTGSDAKCRAVQRSEKSLVSVVATGPGGPIRIPADTLVEVAVSMGRGGDTARTVTGPMKARNDTARIQSGSIATRVGTVEVTTGPERIVADVPVHGIVA
jgi:hypothetical protein